MRDNKLKNQDNGNELAVIASFSDHYDAVMLKGELDAFGIYCVLFNDNFGSLYPMMSFMGGAIKVMVREKDLERAKAILLKGEPLPDGE